MAGFWKWKKKDSLSTLLLWCICIQPLGLGMGYFQSPCQNGKYYATKNGTCCKMCDAGYKHVADCLANGNSAMCKRCPKGQYTDRLNYTPNCRSCRSCKEEEFEEEVSPCKANNNTVCRCKNGFYKEPKARQCLECSKCGPGEMEKVNCSSESNTKCKCEKDHYRTERNKCIPCKKCNAPSRSGQGATLSGPSFPSSQNCHNNSCEDTCHLYCPSFVTKDGLDTDNKVTKIVMIGSCVLIVLLVMVGAFTFKVTKMYTKSKLKALSVQPEFLQESDKVLIHCEDPPYNEGNMAIPQSLVYEQELAMLPSCNPLDVKIPALIYTLLDLVPVACVKQLVRSLGVTDIEIEYAERDYHTCKEAHYQMLRVWAERASQGAGGRERPGGVLHRPLIQELLDKLRDMNLGAAVEKLETKYGIMQVEVGASSSGHHLHSHIHSN